MPNDSVTDDDYKEDDDAPEGWVNLSSAIEALRRDLATAWRHGKGKRVRFKVEPVELTVQAAVTKTGKGQAGIKWHILTIGGEKSRENAVTQMVKLRLEPIINGDDGRPSPDQLVSGRNIFADGAHRRA